MATLLELYNLRYTSAGLKNRLTAAIADAAQDVLNEDAATTNHAQRVKWATAALANAPGMAESMMWGLVGNATVAAAGDASTDNDILFVVASLIDTYAVNL
jgi:hypothetical protein